MCALCGRAFTNQLILNAHLAYAHQQTAIGTLPDLKTANGPTNSGPQNIFSNLTMVSVASQKTNQIESSNNSSKG